MIFAISRIGPVDLPVRANHPVEGPEKATS